MTTCNLAVTYVLWFVGGILGLHHVYLNRPRHFFIWCVTWGGMVLGWISEVAQIQEYVDEANNSVNFRKRMKEIKQANPRPELTVGFLGFSMLIGHQLANTIVASIPEFYVVDTWYGPYLAHALAALGASIGVHLVGNMGQQKAPFLLPFLAALCTCPASYFLYNKRAVINVICVIVAGAVSSEYAEWDKKKKPKKFLDYFQIWGTVAVGVLLYVTLYSSNLYFNYRVPTLNGTQIPLREAISNFATTRPWKEANEAANEVIPCLRLYPYDTCIRNFICQLTELSDPGKDAWAMEVLGFESFPDEKAITSQCRKLSKKYHPDRVRSTDKEELEKAQKKFLDIQKACSTFSKTKMKRERKSKWTDNIQQDTVVKYDDIDDDITTSDDDVNNDDVEEDNDEDSYDDDFDESEDYDESSEEETNTEHDVNGETCDSSKEACDVKDES